MYEYQPDRVWFATNKGLLHFNGYEYEVQGEEQGLKGKPVHLVYVTQNGITVAATDVGLFRYAKQDFWQPMLEWPSPGGVSYEYIGEISGQRLVLGTDFGAIVIREGESPIVYTDASLEEEVRALIPEAKLIFFPLSIHQHGTFGAVSQVLEDKQGYLWFAISMAEEDQGCVLRISPSSILAEDIQNARIFPESGSIRFGGAQKMVEAQDGKIWVINSSYRLGINIFDQGSWKSMSLGEKFGGDEYATSICQTQNGNIWISALGKIYSFNGQHWQLYQSPDYPVPGNKMILFPAADGSLWVMGLKSKVIYVDHSEERWKAYPGLNFQAESTEGQWFLDQTGKVVLFHNNQWFAYGESHGLIDAPVKIKVSSKGQVWAAGSHKGVAATALLKGNHWDRHLHPQLSWGIDYRAVFEAKNGSIWFGASVDIAPDKGQRGGLLQLMDPFADQLLWKHHASGENGLNQSNAYGIGQSPDGRIWVGGGSLYAYDGNSWAQTDQENLQEYVNAIYSQDSLLLVGSRFYGLYVFDGKSWVQYDTDSGLVSNTVISLYADSVNSIWVATENDISRFDGSKWVNHIFPDIMNLDFEGGEFRRSLNGNCWINKSPREWKRRALSYNQLPPGNGGQFICYRYQPDKNPPDVHFLTSPKEVPSSGNLVLSWQGEDYLNLTKKEKLQYSYRVDEGIWSGFTLDRSKMFTYLSSGTHIVEVRARDQDFNIDPTPARLIFEVLVPLWKQPAVLALVGTFIITLAVFVYIIILKNQTLSKLNFTLQETNDELQEREQQVLKQNEYILAQQQEIINQKDRLEVANLQLASSNTQIEQQRDSLKEMVAQVRDLSKARLDFFTNISHELRTPLTLLLGPIEQLLRDQGEISTKQREELLQLVNRNANRLLILINQLLELRKIEHSSLDISPQPGNLLQTVEATMSLFQNLAKSRRLHLSLENTLTQDWYIFDQDKMEKILANLLSNAFKYTPNHGHVYVSLEKKMSEVSTQEMLRICIADDGNGIASEDLTHIFDRYYTATRGTHFSTGIGMSYIRELVQLQGGKIELESEEGVGTIVTIDLPYLPCAESDLLNQPKQSPGLKEANLHVASLSADYQEEAFASVPEDAKTILIIEDNEDMRKFIVSLLSQDYRVLEAENGKKGLELAKAQSPDLIISDVAMPEMDGLEMCKHVKNDLLTSHIPVILLTAKTRAENEIEGYHQGADAYITKPFQSEVLKAQIQNILEQRVQLRIKYQQQVLLQPNAVKLVSPDEKMLAKLSHLMEENIDDTEFNVNKMCEALGYSHIQFIRKIKQLTGKKPLELLRTFRLTRSRDLLSQKKLAISEVAYLVGYDLPNSFSRAFRKEYGISPSEFLEKDEN